MGQEHVAAFFGAALVGVISAAGLFLYGHYKQEKKRNTLSKNVNRLEEELFKLRLDFNQLVAAKNKEEEEKKARRRNGKSRSSVVSKANSVLSNSSATSNEDLFITANGDSSASSIGDSSDLEFYDISDEEESPIIRFEEIILQLDQDLKNGTAKNTDRVLNVLENMASTDYNNPNILCRLANAYYLVIEASDDEASITKMLSRGIAVCEKALELAPEDPEVHKGYALLVGIRARLESSFQNRIKDALLFKKHLDIAVNLQPRGDCILYHLQGQFAYNVANRAWYERGLTSLMGLQDFTVEEAYQYFLKAEMLWNNKMPDNKLMLGQCLFDMRKFEEAEKWLVKALEGTYVNKKNRADIDRLLKQCRLNK